MAVIGDVSQAVDGPPPRRGGVDGAADLGPVDPGVQVADETTLARGGAVNLVGAGIYGLLSFALTVLIGRQLGASGTGAFLIAVAIFNILTRSSLLGTDLGLVRFLARARAEGRVGEVRASWRVAMAPVVVTSTVAGVGLFVFAPTLARLAINDRMVDVLTTYLRTLAPFVPVAVVYAVFESGCRGFGTMLPSVVIERVARPALTPILMATVFALGLGSAAIALSWVVPTLLALIPLAIWTSHLVTRAEQSMVLRWQARGEPVPPPVDERDLMQRFWRFTLPRSLGSFFQLGLLWLDTVLLGALAGSREAGIYAASTRWLLAGNFVGTAVTLAFAPQITYVLSQRSPLRSRRLFEFATVWFLILAWPTYLTVMVFAPVLVRSFGRGFSSGAIVLVIIGAGFLFGAAAGPVDVLLNMLGESRLSLIDTGLGLALNVGLNLALIPRLGAVGAAYAWALSIVVINLLPLVQVKSRYGLHPAGPRWSRAIGIGVAYGAVAVSARLLVGPTLAGLAVGVAAGGVLVLALLWWGRDRLGVSDFVAALPPLRRDRAGTAGATAEGGSQ